MIRHYDVASGETIGNPAEVSAERTPVSLPTAEERLTTLHEAMALDNARAASMPADMLQADIGDFIARQR